MALNEEAENNKGPTRHDHRIAIIDTAALFYLAGSETTAAAIRFFLIAVGLYPDVQKKAQRELDDMLVAQGRLPMFEDAGSLPYISAVVKEVLRWQPVAPVGIPHVSTADYIYNGYFIPKGTTVIANAWAMLRDPKVYPDPNTFRPERFINVDGSRNDSVTDPLEFVFGFGRRICPGSHIASSTLFITIASFLYLFDIGKPTDEASVELPAEADAVPCLTGLARGPSPFKCKLTLRDGAPKEVIAELKKSQSEAA